MPSKSAVATRKVRGGFFWCEVEIDSLGDSVNMYIDAHPYTCAFSKTRASPRDWSLPALLSMKLIS